MMIEPVRVLVFCCFGLSLATVAAGAEAPAEDQLKGQVVATALRAEAALDEIEKDLEKRIKQRNKRQSRAKKSMGRKMSREDHLKIIQVYRGEQSLFHGIRGSIADQRLQLAQMKKVEVPGVQSLGMHAVEVSWLATEMESLRAGVAKREQEFTERWNAIEETGMNPHFREQKAEEEKTMDILRKLHLQREGLVRYTLAVSGSMSLEEGAARNARILERERERYSQRKERLEESKRAWAGLLIALGTAAVVSGVEAPSVEERRESVRARNRTLALECAAGGGFFFQPSEDALGTCMVQ